MAENPKEWPRVHTCLRNWCPEKHDDCRSCDAIIDIIRNQERLGPECEKALHDNLWELYAR